MHVQREPTPDPTHVERFFATRLREIREQRGLSQAAVAKCLLGYGIQLDPTAITRIEKVARFEKNADEDGRPRIIRLSEAVALASALGVSLSEMLLPAPGLAEELEQAQADLRQADASLAHITRTRADAQRRVNELQQAINQMGRL